MMDDSVVIVYPNGATFQVTDAAAAERVHPDARIVRYFDGRDFVHADDPSIVAAKEAREKAAAKAKPKTAPKDEDTPKAGED